MGKVWGGFLPDPESEHISILPEKLDVATFNLWLSAARAAPGGGAPWAPTAREAHKTAREAPKTAREAHKTAAQTAPRRRAPLAGKHWLGGPRRCQQKLEQQRRLFRTLHLERRTRRWMARPTAMWRISWRVALSLLLVWRVFGDVRKVLFEARCDGDALLPECAGRNLRAVDVSEIYAAVGWTAVAVVEMVLNVRTGSIDESFSFDLRPRAAFRRYARGALALDLLVLPPWDLYVSLIRQRSRIAKHVSGVAKQRMLLQFGNAHVHRTLTFWKNLLFPDTNTVSLEEWFVSATADFEREVDLRGLALKRWWRNLPPVRDTLRFIKGMKHAQLLLDEDPPFGTAWLCGQAADVWLGVGLERYANFVRALPRLADAVFEVAVIRAALYSLLTSVKAISVLASDYILPP
ncbi:hypothetical protein M885DRAFT_574274 [Pelagophyceae sp. CCMP2097]|nr:hypothetical protein M885DRAFT_574274 [Pelagophyceae sp. CCMP2097]